MTRDGQYRHDLLAGAVAADPDAEWTPASVMGLMRADGTPCDRASANSLLGRLDDSGVLTPVERGSGRVHVRADR